MRVPTSVRVAAQALEAGHIERVLGRSELLTLAIVAAECEGVAHGLDDAAVEGKFTAEDVLQVVDGGADITGIADATLATDVAGLLVSFESTSNVSTMTEIIGHEARCI
jgi:hypothetical protein